MNGDMATGVVISFGRTRRSVDPRAVVGRFDVDAPRRRRGLIAARIDLAREAVRAVLETLAYLSEPRVYPPMREPKRLAR